MINEKDLEKLDVFNTPELLSSLKLIRESQAEWMVDNVFKCDWATVHVKRIRDLVFLTWWIKKEAGTPALYEVRGEARAIELCPDPDNIHYVKFADGRGDGTMNLKLQEGDCYLITFSFVNTPLRERNVPAHVAARSVHFYIAIPLSPERKRLLGLTNSTIKAVEDLQHDMESFLVKQEAFDAKLQQGIARIKTKNLSSDEEERQIADFTDYARQLKERHDL